MLKANLVGLSFALAFTFAIGGIVFGIGMRLPLEPFWLSWVLSSGLLLALITISLWWLRVTVTKALEPLFNELSFLLQGNAFVRSNDNLRARVGRLSGIPRIYIRWTAVNPAHCRLSLREVTPYVDSKTRQILNRYLIVPTVRILENRIEYWNWVVMSSPFRPAAVSAELIKDAINFLASLGQQLSRIDKKNVGKSK